MKKDNYVVSFMKLYSSVLQSFINDYDYYNININYDEENELFSISIFNETKHINAFYKDFILNLKNASTFKNIIRNDFIKKYKIYLPYIQNGDDKFHVIKGYKFSLYIPILDSEIKDTDRAQKKALKKMLSK